MPNVYRPRLRVLVDSVYVQISNLSGSSTYHKYVSLVRELVERGHFVYWMVPDADYVPNEIENHPNVGIIRTSAIQDQFVVDGLITDDFFNLFNRVAGKYHIDVLCTSRTSLSLYYRRVLEPPRFHDVDKEFTDKGYGLPVITIEEFPQTRERQHSSRSYWLSQCTGYIGSDKTIFLSDHNREEVSKEMLEWFRRTVVEDWVEKTRIIPAGIETKQLDKVYDDKRWKLEKDFHVISIGRLFGVSYVQFLPWFDYLYRSGRKDVFLTVALSGALSGPMKAKLGKIGFDYENNFGRQFKLYENNPRSNFLKMLKRYHAFIVPVSHLDHPTGIFEALYLGLPGIMPVSDYQRTFFSDYPFVIEPSDKAGFLARLLWIKDNREEAREMIAPWRGIIRDKYDAKKNISQLADEIEESARRYADNFKTSSGVINLLKELKGERYKWVDVVAYLRKSGWMGVSVGDMTIRTTFTYARSAVHHAMHLCGYVDPCDGPDDRFVRRDVFEREVSGKPVKKKTLIRKR